MRPRNPEAEPKPFVWVPVPKEAPQRGRPTTHERFTDLTLTGKLELTLTVVSEHLFVGSGAYEFDPNHGNQRPDVWYTFYRRNGQICIPGTSLKGMTRAIVEAISNSCVSQSRRSEHVPEAHSPKRCQVNKEDPRRSSLCPTCRLFGLTGLRGRVHFADALPVGSVVPEVIKIGELWEPRRYGGRKFYEVKQAPLVSDKRPQKNYRFVEAVAKGSRFHTTLFVENLAKAELGLLAYALGWRPEKGAFDRAFTPKLGGAKPRCFGAVHFNPDRLTLWEMQRSGLLQSRVMEQDNLLSFLARCMEAASQPDSGLFHAPSWCQLVEGLQEKSETCPREMY